MNPPGARRRPICFVTEDNVNDPTGFKPSSSSGPAAAANPVKALQGFGQSVWLDYLRRSLFTSGEFQRLIDEDGLRGVTSNPSIFQKAIAGSTDYLDRLKTIERQRDADPMALYEAIAIGDIREAADLLRPVYDQTKRGDGYASLEVSPYLGRDTAGTIADARRLTKAVARENVMIKVPGTAEGVPAIRQLLSEGLNINITLLFGVDRYEEVAHAYIDGLTTFAANGGDVAKVASVASFFVSRIDTMVDGLIAKKLEGQVDAATRQTLEGLFGKIAIANAKLAYERYLALLKTEQWLALAAKGARPQRLLWASTSTKNPKYRDVLYVEELIGPDTIDTMPPATIEAFRDHGIPRATLQDNVEGAHEVLAALDRSGISLLEVTDRLVEDGVRLFSQSFDELLATVDKARRGELKSKIDCQSFSLSADQQKGVAAVVSDWQQTGKARRLWGRDQTLWTGHDENQWLGWLTVANDQLAHLGPLTQTAGDIKEGRFTHAVLLGMGGSSLCPEVMRRTFGRVAGYPELHVLDSTDPAQVLAVEHAVDLARTLFIVSSKSGTTLEPNILMQYFMARVTQAVGEAEAPHRFLAITDPGSTLQQIAERERFRGIFPGVPSIGGRYSALSNFGIVPSAVMGLDVARLLDRAELMVHSCAASVPAESNPGVALGALLGTLGAAGRDKVTLVTAAGVSDLGAWLEQLIAESTGKDGKGLIPVDREPIGPPEVYGADRVFVQIRLDRERDAAQDAAVDALERAGHPIVRIDVPERDDIGQEFFRWEMAIAVAGAVMGINPFNQPDVEASKIATRKLTSAFERTGTLPAEQPFGQADGLALFADPDNAKAIEQAAAGDSSLAGYLAGHLGRLRAGDYFALLAYVAMTPKHEAVLQAMRQAVRDRRHVATCLGFGPRFLHSTGQAYKGGPNTGVFLQITCDDARDVPVPGQKYSFGIVKAAQARGDFAVLAERRRRALRVHLGPDVDAGLEALRAALLRALK
ncbi:MAG TPA: bifunctional transaldolase/phosoglucose isomerase [Vicinamibacterales bacterium]|nr:bifunctional transaldolase/phosoglucose isomerase [Vicinamibacterales bacterium]